MVSAKDCAVLFDLDGVIVDTTEGHFASFRILGDEAGYTISEAQFREVFGRRNEDIFPYLYGRSLPTDQIAWLADRKESIFRDLIRDHIHPLPGVMDLLPALRAAGFRLTIGTSTPRANVDLIISSLEIGSCFATIVSAEDVTKGKPDPEVFATGADRLHVPYAQCVVVEDAVAGVQAALRGGMKSLAVTTNHSREALYEAHRVVDSLEEVAPEGFLALINA